MGGGPLSVAAAGTVSFTSATPTIGGLSGAGSLLLGNPFSNATSLTVNINAASTFSGAISEVYPGGSLTKAGPGTLLLSSPLSAYSGATVINGGNLAVTNSACVGSGGVTINNGTFEVAGSYTDTTPINFAGPNAALQVDAGQTYTYNGSMTAAAGGTVTKTGPGSLLMGSSLPAAPLVVNGGVLDLGTADACPHRRYLCRAAPSKTAP